MALGSQLDPDQPARRARDRYPRALGADMSSPVALFYGYDANGNSGLWVSDGTAAGTGKISAAAPYAIVQLGSEVLDFSGGLWVTDGSAAGTSELSIAGASSGFYINPDSVIRLG